MQLNQTRGSSVIKTESWKISSKHADNAKLLELPNLSIYINCCNHPINFSFGGGTMPYVPNLHLKLKINGTSGSPVIEGSKLENYIKLCIMCIISIFWCNFSNWALITDELLVWESRSFNCRLAAYGVVPPPKMKLIGWLKQFSYMRKKGLFCIFWYDLWFSLGVPGWLFDGHISIRKGK